MPRSQSYLFRRYLWLYSVIAPGPISFADIRERWQNASLNDDCSDLAHKTFENHRRAVEEIMGVNIMCDRRTNLYYIDPDSEGAVSPVAKRLAESLTLNRILADEPELRRAVEMESVPAGTHLLGPILECLRDSRKARIAYNHGYHTERHADYTVIPAGLKLFRRRWYLIALASEGLTPYSYSLDRIDSFEAAERHDVPRPKLRELYRDYYGIIRDPERTMQHIVVKVSREQALYIESLPLHHTQREVRRDASHVWFAMDLVPAYDFIMELLANGRDLEVVEPQSLREEVAREIETMKRLYDR